MPKAQNAEDQNTETKNRRNKNAENSKHRKFNFMILTKNCLYCHIFKYYGKCH